MKSEWTWNKLYKELYEKAKALIKTDVCMKFYHKTEHPILKEMDALRVGLWGRILHVGEEWNCLRDTAAHYILRPIAFVSKSLLSTEIWYSNLERGILQSLQKFHHYSFAREYRWLQITGHYCQFLENML